MRVPSPEWRESCMFLRELLDLNCREAVSLLRHFHTLDNVLDALEDYV